MDGWITIGTKLDTKKFDRQIQELELKAQELEDMLHIEGEGALNEREIFETEVELEKVRNKLAQIRKQQQSIDNEAKKNILGSSFQDAVKKAGKLVLATFGIRSAYMAIRSASSELANYDEQYATNLEYIRWALTQAIAPVLKWIVEKTMILMQYLYAILNAWFGISKKIDVSANSFRKMKAGASGVSKAVKEIKKDLLGFDEINRLTEETAGGVSAGAGGTGIPTLDFSDVEDVKLPEWIENLTKDKDEIVKSLSYIWEKFVDNLKGLWDAISSIFKGIRKIFDGFVDFFTGVFSGDIEKAVGAIGDMFEGFWELIKGQFDLAWGGLRRTIETVKDWIDQNFIKPIREAFLTLWDKVSSATKDAWDKLVIGAKDAWSGITKVYSNVAQFFKDIFTNAWRNVKDVFSSGGKIFDGIKEGIVEAFKNIVNALITGINKVVSIPFNKLNDILQKVHDIEILGAKPFGFVGRISVPQIPKLKTGAIINMPNKGTLVGSGTALGGEAGRERSNSTYRPTGNE